MCELDATKIVILALEFGDIDSLKQHLSDNYTYIPTSSALDEALAAAEQISQQLAQLLSRGMSKAALATKFKSKLKNYIDADDDELNRIISKAMYNAQARHG